MNASEHCLNLIKGFEGFSPVAYRDMANIWTIGYGTIRGVKEGDTTTKEEAEFRLRAELIEYENDVNKLICVSLNQNQFDSLVCLTYNIGGANLRKSTLLKLLNAGNYLGAADQFLVWNKARLGGKLVPIKGLAKRREAERRLFLAPVPS